MATGQPRLEELKASSATRHFRLAVEGSACCLRPVTTTLPLRAAEVRCLTEWRNRHRRAFLHEFVATDERTGRWLSNVVAANPTRILFMLEDDGERPVGYLGLAYIDWSRCYGEADAVVRGEPLPGGTMKRALATLLAFGRRELGLETLGVRVLSDNPACEFYRRCGFVEEQREPLESLVVPDGVLWRPGRGGGGTRALIHFRYHALH